MSNHNSGEAEHPATMRAGCFVCPWYNAGIKRRRFVQDYRRFKRLLFPSHAERAFRKCMGWWWFVRYGVSREYKVYYWKRGDWRYVSIDYALPKYKLGFEIDSARYHQNTVKDYERDLMLARQGWDIVRIWAKDIRDKPREVRRRVWHETRNH